ncbi:hypothetical protein Nhal_0040 [Nitrosococcus halophilus Nc 4]|uniref:HTH cro/C1-type domain-containing protein n=1 Tax=Nitrosococcus halophilus (strain Nc4) TaxID=472759 RepID=D5C473_NITHN|nr:helix-turn-helix transcriptional regulator [Nitrosococcus halophilus]ADE13261.1 hypothetical protein Nhal_0040 [Nitrosococcus halophilus Nc 4]
MSDFLERWASEAESNRKICAREDLVVDVTEDLLIVMEDKGVSKSDLAQSLSKSKSFVTQILSGSRNMTLHTLSDICFALNIKPKISFSNLNNGRCINGENRRFDWERDEEYQESADILKLTEKRPREERKVTLNGHREDGLKYA